MASVSSTFCLRREKCNSGYDHEPLAFSIELKSEADKIYINSFEGIRFIEQPEVGSCLIWRTVSRKDNWNTYAAYVKGEIYLDNTKENLKRIGEFELEGILQASSGYENPLTLILKPLMKSNLKNHQPVFTEDFCAPLNMSAFVAGSQDGNPIHLKKEFSCIGDLEKPIVHGMWSAAKVIAIAKRKILNFDGSRLRKAKIRFLSPVYLGDHLKLECFFLGVKKSNLLYDLILSKLDNERVLQCELKLALPLSAHIYTGQGSQQVNMGSELQKKYRNASSVWTRADTYTRKQLGFSIKRIVGSNPSSVTIDGIKWSHPLGVLNLTQFTQVALLTYEVAERKALEQELGHVAPALFAGHSLGEFSALAAEGVLPLEKAINIVYLRGKLMQSVIQRDDLGNSPWGMTVLKGRAEKKFGETEMIQLVDEVAKALNQTFEIVNFNVSNHQYSVVGTLSALNELESILRELHGDEKSFSRLKGIDIPFHSSVMSPMVDEFRKALNEQIDHDLQFNLLEGRYVPNLTGKPFTSDEKACSEIANDYSSIALRDALDAGYTRNRRARTMLIELLALQFASPVQWIETQAALIDPKNAIDRIVEFGPRAHLKRMLNKTLEQSTIKRPIDVLSFMEDAPACIFSKNSNYDVSTISTVNTKEEGTGNSNNKKVEKVKSPEEKRMCFVTNSKSDNIGKNTERKGTGYTKLDIRLKATDASRAVLALRANCSIDDIKDEIGIDELFAGNSTRRNQVIADLDSELDTSIFDGNYDKPLGEILKRVEEEVKYVEPKAYLLSAIEDMVRRLFYPGFSRKDANAYLYQKWGIDDAGAITVLVRAVLESRKKSGKKNIKKRFESESKVKEWLDEIVEIIASEKNISLESIETETSQFVKVDASVIDDIKTDLFDKDGRLARAFQSVKNELGSKLELPFHKKMDVLTKEKFNLNELYEKEHGEKYISVIEPHFSKSMIYTLDNSFQWVKSKIVKSYWDCIEGKNDILNGMEYQLITHYHSKNDHGVRSIIDYYSNLLRDNIKEKPQLKSMKVMLEKVRNSEKVNYDLSTDSSLIDDLKVITSDDVKWILDAVKQIPTKLIGNFQDGQVTAIHADDNMYQKIDFYDLLNETLRKRNADNKTLKKSSRLKYKDKVALLTGVHSGSIAFGMAARLLADGAHVIVAGRRPSLETRHDFRKLYIDNAGPGSKLTIVPCSQGSTSDIRNLILYLEKNTLYPDYLIPFGALPEENDISEINGDESMATLRLMLFGVEYLIGKIAALVGNIAPERRFCNILLPLSPNVGTMGNDGLYGESKIGLKALIYKWVSEYEYWGKFTKIAGCEIGWVKGTGLMASNDVVSKKMEKEFGIRTFDIHEISNLLCIILYQMDQDRPTVRMFDLGFGLATIPNLGQKLRKSHAQLKDNIKTEKRVEILKSEYQKLSGKIKKYVSPSDLPKALVSKKQKKLTIVKEKKTILDKPPY